MFISSFYDRPNGFLVAASLLQLLLAVGSGVLMLASCIATRKPWGSVYQRGGKWSIKYYRHGRPFRESSHSSDKADAERLLALRRAQILKGEQINLRAARIRMDQLLELPVVDYRRNLRKSLPNLEGRIRSYLGPFFRGRRAAEVTALDIQQFILTRQQACASNAEINRELSVLKRAYSLGMQAGFVTARPYIPMLRENNVRKGFFELHQFEALLLYLTEAMQAVVVFAYVTGWRIQSEILGIQWPQVDFKAETIRLEPGTTKNDDGRIFPFTDRLRSLLVRQREKAEILKQERGLTCPWVFHRDGKPIKSFRLAFKTACRKAGLSDKIPHDLRRTAVRNLVRAGVPERVAMQLTGHRTRSVFERYNVTSEVDLREAAVKLNRATQVQRPNSGCPP